MIGAFGVQNSLLAQWGRRGRPSRCWEGCIVTTRWRREHPDLREATTAPGAAQSSLTSGSTWHARYCHSTPRPGNLPTTRQWQGSWRAYSAQHAPIETDPAPAPPPKPRSRRCDSPAAGRCRAASRSIPHHLRPRRRSPLPSRPGRLSKALRHRRGRAGCSQPHLHASQGRPCRSGTRQGNGRSYCSNRAWTTSYSRRRRPTPTPTGRSSAGTVSAAS